MNVCVCVKPIIIMYLVVKLSMCIFKQEINLEPKRIVLFFLFVSWAKHFSGRVLCVSIWFVLFFFFIRMMFQERWECEKRLSRLQYAIITSYFLDRNHHYSFWCFRRSCVWFITKFHHYSCLSMPVCLLLSLCPSSSPPPPLIGSVLESVWFSCCMVNYMHVCMCVCVCL